MNYEQTKNLIGRILISAIFIYAIPGKIINFERTIELITDKNIPPFIAPVLLISAILCLMVGSILFISGFKQRLGASLLLVFIVPTTFIFHFFPFQLRAVLINSALIGGLILGLNKVKSNSLKDLFNAQNLKRN
tara:strand:- start:615 stop:1016 length:402 start_codon:yes stop_codon:yes gene_type:complete